MTGLIVDLFAGGASTGIEAALGCSVDIAINHSPVALAVHQANHPGTRHLTADIFAPVYVERFWSRVDKSGECWLWTGGRQKRPDGSLSYGIFCVGKKRILAHVYAWTSEHGALPAGQVLRHGCDTPPCVRHLEPGTQAENLADMRARGRAYYNAFKTGVDHHNSKMDEAKVRRIRQLRAEGLSVAKIGAEVGLHGSTVHDIVTGKTWKAVA